MPERNTALICNTEESALMIVDIQTKLTAVMPVKVLARLQRNTESLIKASAALGIPVFATEQYPQGLGNMEKDLTDILPAETGRYEKTGFSCASNEDFRDDLRQSERKQVILTGMETHVCILQTAMDLLNTGYQVIIVADAVCSRHRDSYENALNRMRATGVTIANTESVIFEWLRDAKHEHFKRLQSLIR